MSKERKFVPLPEAQTARLRTVVELPFGLEESVGLNVQRVHLLCQIGGFSFLRIVTDPHGETSLVAVQTVGVDAEGGAVAGKGIIKRVPTCTHEYQGGDILRIPLHQGRWSSLTLTFNTPEIQQRILAAGENIKKVAAWARELNQALTRGMVNAGIRHLLLDLDTFEKIITSFFYSQSLALASGIQLFPPNISKIHAPKIEDLIFCFIDTGALWYLWGILWYGVEKPGKGRRFSLFCGPELDRAAVLWILGKTQPLVKEIPPPHQPTAP